MKSSHTVAVESPTKYDGLLSTPRRPLISFDEEEKRVYHNSQPCKVVLRKDKISVGCSDITPEAAKFIYERWFKEFGVQAEREVVI